MIRIILALLLVSQLLVCSVEAAPPQQTPSWHTLGTWQAEGTLTTEKFRVSVKEWRVVWQSRDENGDTGLQIYVYRENGEMAALIDNVSREGANPLFLYEAGSYYLKVNSTRPCYVSAEARY